MITHTVISQISDLSSCQDDWNHLFTADSKATLFNSYAWAESWTRFYWQPEFTLHIVLIKESDHLLALLPLYVNSEKNRIMFLGTGEPEHCEVATEYLDFLIDTTNTGNIDIDTSLESYLDSIRSNTLELTNCLEDSHVFRITARMSNVHFNHTGRCFQLDLSQSYEKIVSGFSKNQRKKIREITNRFNKCDELEFQSPTAENFEGYWAALRELHTRDWESRGKPGAFSDQVFSDFHLYMHSQYPTIKQMFSFLHESQKITSINHYYQFENKLYFYSTGTNRSRYENLSPGILLHALSIVSLSGQSLTYDFMKGSISDSYKAKFCQSTNDFYTITVYRNGIAGFIAFNLYRMRRCLSVLKRQLIGLLKRNRSS